MSQKEKTTSRPSSSKTEVVQAITTAAGNNLNRIIKNNGYQKGRLFYSHNKATYTFLDRNDVISLHFDLEKRDLFFKGHKIVNWEMVTELPDYLDKFKKALLHEKISKQFLSEFDNAVMKLNKI